MLSTIATRSFAKALRWHHAFALALLLVFGFQVATATQHDHGMLQAVSDCSKCYMAAQVPGPLPAAPLLALVGLALFLHYLLAALDQSHIRSTVRIIPPPRGPPAR